MNKNNELIVRGGINIFLQGKYRLQVIDSLTKTVVSDYGWHKNLILNNGMDQVASFYIADLNAAGVCGTGSRPNSITSSTSEITQSGAQLYLVDNSGLISFTASVITNGTSSYTSSVSPGDLIIDSDNSWCPNIILLQHNYCC